MLYKIEWMEKKITSTGKEKIDATLSDGTHTIEGVTIWADFPNFATLMAGHPIEGNVSEKQNGQYLNRTLYPLAPKPVATTTSGFKGGGQPAKLMEKKAQQIEHAQDNKSLGIKISSTIRMAVDLTVAQMNKDEILQVDEAMIKGMIKNWRRWLWDEFESPIIEQPPF